VTDFTLRYTVWIKCFVVAVVVGSLSIILLDAVRIFCVPGKGRVVRVGGNIHVYKSPSSGWRIFSSKPPSTSLLCTQFQDQLCCISPKKQLLSLRTQPRLQVTADFPKKSFMLQNSTKVVATSRSALLQKSLSLSFTQIETSKSKKYPRFTFNQLFFIFIQSKNLQYVNMRVYTLHTLFSVFIPVKNFYAQNTTPSLSSFGWFSKLKIDSIKLTILRYT